MATIAQTIESMRENLSNAYTSLEGKGATIPTDKNLYNLASTIDTVTAGGGEEDLSVELTAQDVAITELEEVANSLPDAGGSGVTDGLVKYIAGDATLTELKASDFGDITSLKGGAFFFNSTYMGTSYLKKITLPKTVSKIGSYAFYGLSSLEEINNLDVTKLTGTTSNLFYACSYLNNINNGALTLSADVNHSQMFYNCNRLNNMKFTINCTGNASQFFTSVFYNLGSALGSSTSTSSTEIIINGQPRTNTTSFGTAFYGARLKKVVFNDAKDFTNSSSSPLKQAFQSCYIDEISFPVANYLVSGSASSCMFMNSNVNRLRVPALTDTSGMFYQNNTIKKIFIGANCKLKGTGTSYIPATSKNFVPYTAIDTYSQGTNWTSLFLNSGVGETRMAVYGNFASGDTLPTQIGTAQVYNVTWYEDDDFTTEISGTATENKEYYGKLSAVV
jgi:hypothetical protein